VFLYIVEAYMLAVHSRYITVFAKFLEGKQTKLGQLPLTVLDTYIALLVFSNRSWSIRNQLLLLHKEHLNSDSFIHDVCCLVKVFLIMGGKLKNLSAEAIDWMSGRICYIEHIEKILYKITKIRVLSSCNTI